MKTINKRLIRLIKETRGQFIAVTVVLVVGLVFYTAMGVSAVNLERAMDHYYDEYSFADLSVSVNRVTDQQIKMLANFPEIMAAEGRVVVKVPLINEEENERAKVELITLKESGNEINKLRLEEGSLLNKEDRRVLVIKQFATARDLHPGDSIELQISGKARSFEIAGIVSSPEFVYLVENSQSFLPDEKNYGVVFINEGIGGQLLGYGSSYNDIQMLEASGLTEIQRDDLVEKIDDSMKKYYGQGVVKRESQFSNALLDAEVEQLNRMATALPVLFLIIAGLILAMMIGRMVKRDRQPIGIMKAIGYSTKSVVIHYVRYALCIAVVGGLLGSIIGMFTASAMSSLYTTFFNIPELNKVYDYQYIFTAILLSMVFCSIAGVLGTRSIIKISPAESMQADAPKKGKHILLERIRFLWKRLSFSEKVAIKNVFRNKKRTIFILAGVSVTCAMMVFITCMPKMMSDMMGDGLKEYQSMDYNVNFTRPVSAEVIKDIEHEIDGISEIEGKIEYPYKLSNGTEEISMSVIGVSADSLFHTFKDTRGNVLEIPETGMLISDYAAAKLKVSTGDMVKMHSYLSDTEDRWVEVSGIVYQAMGVNGYMDIKNIAKEDLVSGAITGVYFNSDNPDTEKELMAFPLVSSIISMETTRNLLTDYTQMINVSIFFMVVLSGILGFAIVYNATLISIGERETEFSSLRVLGFSKLDIFKLILRENNWITAAGIILGIPITVVFLEYSSGIFSTEQYTMNMRADAFAWSTGIIFTLVFVALAQVATYKKINKLDFLTALKNRA